MTVLPPQGPRRSGDDPDVRDLLAAHALDAVDDVERARVERLLRTDPDAAAESASFAETASRLAVATAAPPPAALRARVLDEVSRTRQAAPAGASAVREQRPPAGRRAVRLLAAACGVLLAASAGLGALVIADEDAQPSLVATGDFAGGTAALLQVEGDYVVVGEGVPALPEDRVYQLWALEGSAAPEPAGFLAEDAGAGYVGELDDWQDGATLAITEEPAGGSSQPTGDILATVET